MYSCDLMCPASGFALLPHLLIDVRVLQCVAVCCSVLQCNAVCCSVLQCPALRSSHIYACACAALLLAMQHTSTHVSPRTSTRICEHL